MDLHGVDNKEKYVNSSVKDRAHCQTAKMKTEIITTIIIIIRHRNICGVHRSIMATETSENAVQEKLIPSQVYYPDVHALSSIVSYCIRDFKASV